MKKLLLLTLGFGFLPISMQAQDDMYFVPKKSKTVKTTSSYERPTENTYYSGSSRSVDDYNRRNNTYQVLPNDSANDVIDFDESMGVYPDSAQEDYRITKKMARWDDYTPSESYWDGYLDGRRDSWGFRSWHSPWYYSSFYPWYDYTWYDPWYYGWGWHYGWYDPWYYGSWSWGWGGYYSWHYYHPWHYGWYGSVTHNWSRGYHGNYRGVAHGSGSYRSSSALGSRRTTTATTGSRGYSVGSRASSVGSRSNSNRSSSISPRSTGSRRAVTGGSSSSSSTRRSGSLFDSGSRRSSSSSYESRSTGSFGSSGSRGSFGGGSSMGGSRGGSVGGGSRGSRR